MTMAAPRELREKAAALYKPERVKLLLIAEAPPAAVDRYFYFPEVTSQDSLFRYVASSVLGAVPTRANKAELLGKLRDAGVFLIDVCLNPIFDKSDLGACIPDLVERAMALSPQHIILIKATVYDVAFGPLSDAGLPVVDERIPFPGSGQQLRFRQLFGSALSEIAWSWPDKVA
jgi:hypothetical protein